MKPDAVWQNDTTPMMPKTKEREPMFLLDTTGSMTFPAAEDGSVSRASVLGEAMAMLVASLEGQDSQALEEAAAGEEGGVMTITFAGGTARNIDDLSSNNLREKWNKIRWEGGTAIMPGWDMLIETYLEEFGERSKLDRPAILAVVVTDGEAEDTNEFATALKALKTSSTDVYVVLAIMGYGAEHDKAFKAYQAVAAENPRVRVVSFDGQTDPGSIANDLLSLMG